MERGREIFDTLSAWIFRTPLSTKNHTHRIQLGLFHWLCGDSNFRGGIAVKCFRLRTTVFVDLFDQFGPILLRQGCHQEATAVSCSTCPVVPSQAPSRATNEVPS